MTLEESNAQALAAAEAGDVATLTAALRARRQAIADLKREPATERLASRMRDALAAGDRIAGTLFALKQRMGFESARLARLAEALATGCGREPSPG